jgi:signal transduction histidine kinase
MTAARTLEELGERHGPPSLIGQPHKLNYGEANTLTSILLLLIGGCLGLICVALLLKQWSRPRVRSVIEEPMALPEKSSDTSSPDRNEDHVEEILERMSEGVVLLDKDLSPLLANAAARALLGAGNGSLELQIASTEVLSIARRAVDDDSEISDTIGVWYPRRGHLRVRATPLSDHGGVVVLMKDITEELRTQRIRREFVAHASHELKSPVASLQTLAEAVRQAVHDDPEMAARFSERMVHEAERLGRLITDLLDLSRLEDPVDVSEEIVDLSAISVHELDAVRGDAEHKAIELISGVAPDVWIKGDEQQLSLMLRNLLDNAIRYTPAGGTVRLDIERADHQVIMSITDTGIGIPLEAQERIFERFYRVDKARSRHKGGTGLGLAIVKHAVELNGGVIELESELERGSTFRVKFPICDEEERR